MDEADEENRKTLEYFFIHDPVQIINKKFALKADAEGYFAKSVEIPAMLKKIRLKRIFRLFRN